ncbi:MAG TPA: hypothetical protein VJZ72_04750 [Candidatus Limnocylindrales bacterium]|nr:hypothetical protein [Candidatus Limnocylindrales bacterium]
MRKLALAAVAGALLMATAPIASASTPRADSYFEVWCFNGSTWVQAESVDSHAIELGGKDTAIHLFSDNYPFGLTCESRPFTT